MVKFNESLELRSGVTLPNRLMMSPMTTKQSFFDGTVTQDEITYYHARAKGLGAVITGAANVQPGGKGWSGELGIDRDAEVPQLAALAGAIHAQGAKAIVQIFHAGRMTDRATLSGEQPVSASAVAAERANAEMPRAMTTAEIQATIEAFGAATRRAIAAGFDGVELHGANTYLLQQFFSPHSNRRTDAFGGSREKRYVFIQAVIDAVMTAVRETADRPFAVGYRLSPEEYETPGIRFDDTLWLVDQLAQQPLDYLHVSLNDFRRVARTGVNDRSILTAVHEQLAGRLPLVGVGGVRTREDVDNVLSTTELVAVGQQLLYDPTWAVKLAQGADAAIYTGPFEAALHTTPMSTPLYDFASRWFK